MLFYYRTDFLMTKLILGAALIVHQAGCSAVHSCSISCEQLRCRCAVQHNEGVPPMMDCIKLASPCACRRPGELHGGPGRHAAGDVWGRLDTCGAGRLRQRRLHEHAPLRPDRLDRHGALAAHHLHHHHRLHLLAPIRLLPLGAPGLFCLQAELQQCKLYAGDGSSSLCSF